MSPEIMEILEKLGFHLENDNSINIWRFKEFNKVLLNIIKTWYYLWNFLIFWRVCCWLFEIKPLIFIITRVFRKNLELLFPIICYKTLNSPNFLLIISCLRTIADCSILTLKNNTLSFILSFRELFVLDLNVAAI